MLIVPRGGRRSLPGRRALRPKPATGGLFEELAQREASGRPVRVAVLAAGRFGTMFLAQALRTTGLHVLGVCDRSVQRAPESLRRAGWPEDEVLGSGSRRSTAGGHHVGHRRRRVPDPGGGAGRSGGGHGFARGRGAPLRGEPAAGPPRGDGTVEADVVAGPALARRARAQGVVYSLGYGDPPALVCELVDWARVCGFEVICAGKGTRSLPHYHFVTPDEVWDHYGLPPELVQRGGSQREDVHLVFGRYQVRGGDGRGGQRHRTGSPAGGAAVPSLRGGSPTGGVQARGCRGRLEDPGTAALVRPTHWGGLEVGVSAAQAALRGEATGQPVKRVAVAKRDLRPGQTLDGEGVHRLRSAVA